MAMRARPSDVRDWQRHGLDDWTVEDVYETYREMENTPTTIMMAERIAKPSMQVSLESAGAEFKWLRPGERRTSTRSITDIGADWSPQSGRSSQAHAIINHRGDRDHRHAGARSARAGPRR
jgi:hypothetical protein